MLHVSFIEAEGEFVNIAAKMLFAGVVINADQTAFENCENAFNAVRGHGVADKLSFAVIDGIMIEKHAADASICPGFVGMQGRADFHMPINFGLDRSGVRVRNCLGDSPAATFAYPENCGLADCATAGLELLCSCLLASIPPTKHSSISIIPRSFLRSGPHASRMRCSMNHADACRMPISFDSCKLEIPLRAVRSRYIA